MCVCVYYIYIYIMFLYYIYIIYGYTPVKFNMEAQNGYDQQEIIFQIPLNEGSM